MTRRIAILALSLVVVAASHWLVPTEDLLGHGLHLLLRKLFVLPVLLAAVWFGLRGATITATAATSLYLPHAVYQWSGHTLENLSQLGELASLWLVALLARIFSVVDAFDAMISDRPYSAAMQIEAAQHVVARESGRQFDPQVVDAFLNIPQNDWARLAQSTPKPELAASELRPPDLEEMPV